MNEVYLEGIVTTITAMEHAASANPHCVCQLRVTHPNRKNQMVNELYTINSWNHLAEWAIHSLKTGMRVCLKGYLTQRMQQHAAVTEVTANHFFIRKIA